MMRANSGQQGWTEPGRWIQEQLGRGPIAVRFQRCRQRLAVADMVVVRPHTDRLDAEVDASVFRSVLPESAQVSLKSFRTSSIADVDRCQQSQLAARLACESLCQASQWRSPAAHARSASPNCSASRHAVWKTSSCFQRAGGQTSFNPKQPPAGFQPWARDKTRKFPAPNSRHDTPAACHNVSTINGPPAGFQPSALTSPESFRP